MEKCRYQAKCSAVQSTALLLLFCATFEQIGPVVSSPSNQLQKASASRLFLKPGADSIAVSWIPDQHRNKASVGGYSVEWSTEGKRRGDITVDDRDGFELNLNINELKACTTYHVSVTPKDEGGTTFNDTTTTLVKEPPAVLRLSPHNVSARRLVLSWERPTTACEITTYNITYSGVAKWEPHTVHTGSATIGRGDADGATSIVIDGLHPYSDYTVVVAAATDAGNGERASIGTTTWEGVPSPPTEIEATSNSPSSITVSWGEPEKLNGLLGDYNVTWDRNLTTGVSGAVTERHYTINGLYPCVEYRVRVMATTEAGEGEPAEVKEATLPAPPVVSLPSCSPNPNTQTILVTWPKPNTFCLITNYEMTWGNNTVLVNNSTLQHSFNLTTQELKKICVAAVVAEERGERACCVRPNTEGKDDEGKNMIIGIIVGVVAALVVLLLLLVVTIKREAIISHLCSHDNARRRRSSDPPFAMDRQSIHLLSVDDRDVARRNWQRRVVSDVSMPELTAEEIGLCEDIAGMIQADNLIYGVCAVVDTYYSDLMARVKEQLETLSNQDAVAAAFNCLNRESFVGGTSAGTLPVNMRKNRYSNIIPFDANRVRLRNVTDTSTDYINASFVKSLVEEDIDFIACQSPTDNSVSDFWWMVWEQNIKIIVMLVRSDEGEKNKCSQYWHVLNERAFSTLVIKTENEEVMGGLVIRSMLLRNERERRTVEHFQFTSWPDFGVPNSENELLMLVKGIRKHIEPGMRHIIVHCSAGVGKTGTFIALWQLQVQTERRRPGIDVKNTVLELRRHRHMLVQKPDQYYFLHSCFLKYLQEMSV